MKELSIGEVARQAGLTASALRYYERAGLLPAPPRRSRQRRYSEAVFGRIYLIRLALEAGLPHGAPPLVLCGLSQPSPPPGGRRGPAPAQIGKVYRPLRPAQRGEGMPRPGLA